MVTQIFNPTAELAIPRGTPINEANAEFERHVLAVEMKMGKYSK